MRCPHCKERVEADWMFCPACEKPIAETDAQSMEQQVGDDEGVEVMELADLPALVASTSQPMPSVNLPRVAFDGLPFSEAARQFPVLLCPNCGAPPAKFDEEGTCMSCGVYARPNVRDSFYLQPHPRLVCVSDYGGKGHNRNEDFVVGGVTTTDGKLRYRFSLGDGTSLCRNPQEASRAACLAADSVLKAAADAGQVGDEALVNMANDAGAQAVNEVRDEEGADLKLGPPATTLIVACLEDDFAHVSAIGDSRLYVIVWVDGRYHARVVTTDHSVLFDIVGETELSTEAVLKDFEAMFGIASQVQQGLLSAEEGFAQIGTLTALASDHRYFLELVTKGELSLESAFKELSSQNAHTMSRALSAGIEFEPSLYKVNLGSVAAIFACSDGPWNDLDPIGGPGPQAFAEIFGAVEGDPLRFAREVLAKASGADNNTVAVITLNPAN